MTDIKDMLKTPQKGGWTQEATEAYMVKHGIKTLEELVKLASGSEKKKPDSWSKKARTAKVPRTGKQDKEMREQGGGQYGQPYSKAHGGYVKKYAKGGGVRKVRT